MERATIELNGLKLDIEFDYYYGKKNTFGRHPSDPSYDGPEINEITDIKIHGTETSLAEFLEGEMDVRIEELVWEYINDNGL